MIFQFTLEAVRISSGYTVKEAAKQLGIRAMRLERYEKDASRMPRKLIMAVRDLYGVLLDFVYFGIAADCIKHNRRLGEQNKV